MRCLTKSVLAAVLLLGSQGTATMAQTDATAPRGNDTSRTAERRDTGFNWGWLGLAGLAGLLGLSRRNGHRHEHTMGSGTMARS